MRAPKGFGKSYFTLTAILAYSVQPKLKASTIKNLLFVKNSFIKDKKELDKEDPPWQIELNQILIKTKLALKINKFIPRCPYYTTYYAFRRSGAHPPNISS